MITFTGEVVRLVRQGKVNVMFPSLITWSFVEIINTIVLRYIQNNKNIGSRQGLLTLRYLLNAALRSGKRLPAGDSSEKRLSDARRRTASDSVAVVTVGGEGRGRYCIYLLMFSLCLRPSGIMLISCCT